MQACRVRPHARGNVFEVPLFHSYTCSTSISFIPVRQITHVSDLIHDLPAPSDKRTDPYFKAPHGFELLTLGLIRYRTCLSPRAYAFFIYKAPQR